MADKPDAPPQQAPPTVNVTLSTTQAAAPAPVAAPPTLEQAEASEELQRGRYRDPSTWPRVGFAYVNDAESGTLEGFYPLPLDPMRIKNDLGAGTYRITFKDANNDKANGGSMIAIGGPHLRRMLAAELGDTGRAAGGGTPAELLARLIATKERQAQQPAAPPPPQAQTDPAVLAILQQFQTTQAAILQKLAEPQGEKFTEALLKQLLMERTGGNEIDRILKYKTLFQGEGNGGGEAAVVQALAGIVGNFTGNGNEERRPAQRTTPPPRQLTSTAAAAPAATTPAAEAAPAGGAAAAPAAPATDTPSADELREQMGRRAITVAGYEIATHAIGDYPDEAARQEAMQHCAIVLTHLTPRQEIEQLLKLPKGLRTGPMLGALHKAFPALREQLEHDGAKAFVTDLITMVLEPPATEETPAEAPPVLEHQAAPVLEQPVTA